MITRPEPDASETAALVAARGFEPVVAPVMALQQRRVDPAGRFGAVIVTSRNAIAALPARLYPLPLLAVGSATARRARGAGFTTVLDAGGDAADLASLARRALPPGTRLLFAHGVGVGDELAASLAAAGFRVTRRRAYAVRPVSRFPAAASEAVRARRLHAATFLSAETARAFVRLLPTVLRSHLSDVDAVAIGERAASPLALLPWRRVLVSVRPTLDEVLAQL